MAPSFKAALLIFSFGGLALFAGLKGHTVALVGSLLVLVAVSMAYLWNRFVFSKLSLERTLNRRQGEFDSGYTMQLSVTNRKLLPLFGLRIEQTITPGLELGDPRKLVVVKDGAYNIFRDYFHLNWYEKRKRTYELYPLRRGRFEFGGGSLSYADPFGLFVNQQEEVFPVTQLIVFPKIVPIAGINSLDTYLFGSRPREGWIFVDPLNRVGTRPYASTDSARQINWKATARHVETQVNVEKPSFDQQVCLILDQPPNLDWWTKQVANNLEVAIMTVASLVHTYCEGGYQLHFLTNLVSKVGIGRAPNRMARGRAQRSQLLTDLALLQNFSVDSLTKALRSFQGQLKPGNTVVIVTTAPGELDEQLVQWIRRLMLKSRVAVIRVVSDSTQLVKTEGLKEWWIEGGEPWNEISSLELF